jgi:signal transduction histidine kinase
MLSRAANAGIPRYDACATVDLRTQTSLIAAVLSIAIAASVLMRGRRNRVHWLFGLFTLTVASWYLTTFLDRLNTSPFFERLNLVCAIALPLAGVQFFRAFIAAENRRMHYLNRGALFTAAVLLVGVFTPLYEHIVLRTAIFLYVLTMLISVLAMVYARGRAATSRFEGARLRYLALVGALAATFTLADYLPLVGLDIPPVGTVLILVFLYVLSQSILRYRLLDLYELAGRLTVLTALAFTLAIIYWVLVELAGGRFFLHSVVAGLVVLLVFDPIRAKVEDKIGQFFFRERYDLEHTVHELRARLAHVLEIEDMTRVVLAGLEQSRRMTHAAIYLVDEDMRGYRLAGHVGPDPVARVDIAPARPLLDRLNRDHALTLENLERELEERRDQGDDREAETTFEIIQTLQAMHASLCLAITGERGELYGLLSARDERLRDAYSPEETALLRGLAAQAAIAIENSRLYSQMKERDRLAALGEMAAGLAHEIRNPLGAIKASAQFLEEPDPGGTGQVDGQREFLNIIVEEVDRLNRVVGSFLDYARPSGGHPAPTDVNATVRRTMQLLGPECQSAKVAWTVELSHAPPPVRIDVEQLRQVLINLVRNAVQAMESGGELTLQTIERHDHDMYGQLQKWIEIRVIDTGPGISPKVQGTLFVPFVTTKDRGTGLGLAISQRIVSAAGGRIDVRSHAGVGTTFVVRLPSAEEATGHEDGRFDGSDALAGAETAQRRALPESPGVRASTTESAPPPSRTAVASSSASSPTESSSGSPTESSSPAEPAGAGETATRVATSR